MPVHRVGNPRLGAVEDVIAVGVLLRHGADRLQVRARIGLCQRQPPANFTSGKPGQPFRLLLRRAEAFDGSGHDEVRIENAGDRHPVAGNAHHDLGIGRRWQTQPAIFLSDGRAEQAHFGHLLHQFFRPDIIVIVILDHGDHFTFQPAVDRVHEGAFFIRINRANLGFESGGGGHVRLLKVGL